MTSGQHIDYDALALEAQRGVVKACLEQVSREGLLGEHHFYVAFNTQAPNVGMSKRLKEKYPVEMTIVLQHRFWDLAVSDDRFEVKLTFDGIPERLVVPFKAVKVFYDPSVPYIVQFEEFDAIPGATPRLTGPRRIEDASTIVGVSNSPGDANADQPTEKTERRRPARKTRPENDRDDAARPSKAGNTANKDDAPSEPDVRDLAEVSAPLAAVPPAASPSKPVVTAVRKADGNETTEDTESAESEASTADNGSAKIFDLSKFRGKK